MKSLSLCCAVLLAIAASNLSVAAEVTEHTTAAGNNYWLLPMPQAKRSAIAVTWQSDLAELPENVEVAARVGIELMLNGGAGGVSAEQIVADFGDLDAGSDLWTQPREIHGFIVAPTRHLPAASEIANLVLSAPNFEQRWLKRIANQWREGVLERQDRVSEQAWNTARHLMFGEHPYQRFWSRLPIDSFAKIDIETVKAWHQNTFATGNAVITVAGSATPEAIDSAIDLTLKGLPATANSEQRAFAPLEITGKTVVVHRPQAPKSLIVMVGAVPPSSAPGDAMTLLANGVLGDGKQSRLFKAVRSKLGASYHVGAGLVAFTREQRLLYISGEVDTEQLAAALGAIEGAYREFRNNGIGPIEFPFARRIMRQRIEQSLEKPEEVAHLLMEARLDGFDRSYVPQLAARADALQRVDVNAHIQAALRPYEELLKIVVTPKPAGISADCQIDDFSAAERCR